MADGRKEPKSKYTVDRGMPGAFEGETVTRRRLMNLTAQGAGAVAVAAFALPALGFAAGSALFDRPPVHWQPVGSADDFPSDTYLPRVITEVPGIGQVGKTTTYVRARNDEIDPPPNPPGIDEQFIAISTRCMHLGCPVRYIDAARRFVCPCHGGVYDFRGLVDRRPAGAAARPLLHPRPQRPGRGRAALLGQLRCSAASRPIATRRRTSTASASTCTPAASPRPSSKAEP